MVSELSQGITDHRVISDEFEHPIEAEVGVERRDDSKRSLCAIVHQGGNGQTGFLVLIAIVIAFPELTTTLSDCGVGGD